MIQIIKRYVTNNMHFKNNRVITVKGLTLHSVGCPQPNPDVFVKQWDTTSNKYLTQLVIGTEKAYEVLPCLETKGKAVFCWQVGSANAYMIGAEMTEPSTIKYTGGSTWVDRDPAKTKAFVLKTYANAVDVFAQLCLFHGLDPLKDGVILSHSECYKRGIGTNHGDVEHIWKKFGLTMNQFRQDVKTAMDNMSSGTETPAQPLPQTPSNQPIQVGDIVRLASNAVWYNGSKIADWVKKQDWVVKSVKGDRVVIDKNVKGTNSICSPVNSKYLTVVESPFKPYMVRVLIEDLNMRTGPDVSFDRIAYIPKGVYTIVEEKGKWGRLKAPQSYNGKYVNAWIHLDYVTKV